MVESAVHALRAPGFGIVLEVTRDGDLAWRHWGANVDPADLPPLASTAAKTTFSFDRDVPLGVLPTPGFGWFGPSGLRCHRDGRQAGQRLKVRSASIQATSFTALLCDDHGGVEITIAITVEGGCLRMRALLKNTGDSPLSVEWLSGAVLPVPFSADAIISFGGRHNGEMVEYRAPMPAHGWYRENRLGLTGHGGPPGLFILGDGAGWHRGEVWAAQLAWSGDHRLSVERDGARGWTVSLGATFGPGEISLRPGEALTAPDVLFCHSAEGRNGAIAAFHDTIRVRRGQRAALSPRPVHFNSWESAYFDHDEARTIALAEGAAALGVERFVLDDGWFRRRTSDQAGLGDWTADPVRYPRGLGPVARRVNDLGMEFGLWVEPEMVNPDSDLYRNHPDWVLGSADPAPLPTARHQLVLDMARGEVRDYLFTALSTLLRDLPIAYLKWDHNRALAPVSGADGRGSATAQIRGTWALWDRVRAAFPHIEIEACAAGGGRIDAGFAERAERFWTSDNIDAVSRVSIQRSFLQFMPPEMMGAHVGASPSHATGRTQSIDFRAMVALPGHFGVELAPNELSSDDRDRLVYWIDRYKKGRDRFHGGRTWLGEDGGVLWQAHGTSDHFLLLVLRTAPSFDGRESALRLPMVEASTRVVVRLIDQAGVVIPKAIYGAGEELLFAGKWLAIHGLPLPSLSGEGAALLEIRSEL